MSGTLNGTQLVLVQGRLKYHRAGAELVQPLLTCWLHNSYVIMTMEAQSRCFKLMLTVQKQLGLKAHVLTCSKLFEFQSASCRQLGMVATTCRSDRWDLKGISIYASRRKCYSILFLWYLHCILCYSYDKEPRKSIGSRDPADSMPQCPLYHRRQASSDCIFGWQTVCFEDGR